MAFTTGTVTDYKDLLSDLKDFLEANDWTIEAFSLGATMTDLASLVVTGPGIVGGQQPHISIATEANTGLNAYGWRVTGHPGYDSGLPFGGQINNGPIHYYLLWPNEMDYWFYVNDRRFIVVAKIGTYYMSMYAGFFLPYALPTEYPFPIFVGATASTLQVYNLNNSMIRSFCDPSQNAASYYRREGLTWGGLLNSYNATNAIDSYGSHGVPTIWPYRTNVVDGDLNTSDQAWGFFRNLRPLANGKMPMWQVHIIDPVEAVVAGVLDGVFATGGFNRAPEQIVTVDAQDYRLFISGGVNDPKHYFAVEES